MLDLETQHRLRKVAHKHLLSSFAQLALTNYIYATLQGDALKEAKLTLES